MPSPSLPALPTLLAGAGALIAAGLASVALLGADAPAPEAPIVEAPVEAPADHTPTREPSWEIEEEQHVQALPSPDTPPHRPATTEDAYGVLGAPAGDLSSAEWFLGQGSLDDGRLSLLIFWESWCPHCDDALLDAEAKHRELAGRGLNVMGFTKLNKGVSVEEAYDHLDDMADGGVSFPNAHDVDSALTERFVVTGVPAAVLVQDGEVIWRDHPRRLDPALLDGLLAAP